MFRSLFLSSLRNIIRKNRLITVINISGLAVGLTCFILVALFVNDEYNFDQYHSNYSRVYRIVTDFTSNGNTTNWAKTSAPVGRYLSGSYPEVEQVVRIRKNPGTDLLSHRDLNFYENRIFFADSTLLKVFDFKLSMGDPSTALNRKNGIILSEKLSKKLFGVNEPIGKSVRFNNIVDLEITGIMEEIPSNSHFIADAFITFSSLDDIFGEKRLNHWGQFDHYTYILLSENVLPSQLEARFPDFLKTNAPEWVSEKEALFLQPLSDIHLYSNRKDEIGINSSEKYSYILSTVALFILLMACANFINLSTATQMVRSKEITIRKVLGATAKNLSFYLWMESFIICVGALCFAFILAYIALPYFNLSTGKLVSFTGNYWILPFIIFIAFTISFLASIFSSFQSSKFNIRVGKTSGLSKSRMRKGLITFQFFTSIFLIISTWIVSSQLNFLESLELGFNSGNVIIVPIKDRSQNEKYKTTVNEILQLRGVEKASFSSSTPGSNNSLTYTYTIVGSESGEQVITTFIVDENFFDLYDIQLKEGRFLNQLTTDTLSEVIVNEAAVRQYGLTNPIGQLVKGKVKGRIVGVIEDFNHTSLHDSFQPVIMYLYTPTLRYISIKLSYKQDRTSIAELERKWPDLYPAYPMEYYFLKDQIQRLYGPERLLNNAYTTFSWIAILIAGIGLMGLTSHLMERKRKEISIRKVVGGSTWQIVQWIYSSYFGIILIATFMSWILGYFWMNKWLEGFAYKIEMDPSHFISPALIMILLLLVTTGIQTTRASITNPVDNLRED